MAVAEGTMGLHIYDVIGGRNFLRRAFVSIPLIQRIACVSGSQTVVAVSLSATSGLTIIDFENTVVVVPLPVPVTNVAAIDVAQDLIYLADITGLITSYDIGTGNATASVVTDQILDIRVDDGQLYAYSVASGSANQLCVFTAPGLSFLNQTLLPGAASASGNRLFVGRDEIFATWNQGYHRINTNLASLFTATSGSSGDWLDIHQNGDLLLVTVSGQLQAYSLVTPSNNTDDDFSGAFSPSFAFSLFEVSNGLAYLNDLNRLNALNYLPVDLNGVPPTGISIFFIYYFLWFNFKLVQIFFF